MAFDGGEQAGIIELMSGKYRLIAAIEGEWGIRLHAGDMRPRIEHFHDAVRALTSGEASIYEKNSRLSVEHLAYDVGQLRGVSERPLGSINRATEKSVGTAVVKAGEAGASYSKMPPQQVRSELVSLYRDYTVFFAALFAQVADINYKTRSNAIDDAVNDIGLIEDILEQLLTGKMTNAQAMNALMHVERDDLREKLQAVLSRKSMSAREKQEARALLAQIEKGLASEKKSLDQSHLSYATGQLAIYEDAKDTVKKLAGAGLNLAGKFLENAMAAAKGAGRGRGV